MKFIKDFKEISAKDILFAGGKGANLGELIKMRMPVPDGFVVLASAFERFLEDTDINVEIEAIWNKINIEDIELVEESSEILRNLILEREILEDLKKEILKAYDDLNQKSKIKNQNDKSKSKIEERFYVAVRSSATAEDSKIDSWAGELETYLNTTRENLLENIKKCWASLFTPRAIFYRFQRKLNHKPVSVAVVVQKMVQSEVSGVCFTVHPVTKDKNQMIIEAVWGLGEILVSGQVTPDSYVVEKLQIPKPKLQINFKSKIPNFKILDVNISGQEKMIVRGKKGTQIVPVPISKRNKRKLSEKEIKELAKLCVKIENHFKDPQDIEWALEKSKFYILQTRPITTL